MELAGDDDGPKNEKRTSESSSEHDVVAPTLHNSGMNGD